MAARRACAADGNAGDWISSRVAKTIAVLFNPTNQYAEQMGDVRETAHRIGVELTILDASSESEFTGAFATMSERKAGALLVGADPFFNSRRAQLIELAAQYRIPAIYQWREFALEGGLMSYGTVLVDAYRQAGNYAGRILKSEKPDDLPVVQPTKYQLVINLKTAKALGLESPPRYRLVPTTLSNKSLNSASGHELPHEPRELW